MLETIRMNFQRLPGVQKSFSLRPSICPAPKSNILLPSFIQIIFLNFITYNSLTILNNQVKLEPHKFHTIQFVIITGILSQIKPGFKICSYIVHRLVRTDRTWKKNVPTTSILKRRNWQNQTIFVNRFCRGALRILCVYHDDCDKIDDK